MDQVFDNHPASQEAHANQQIRHDARGAGGVKQQKSRRRHERRTERYQAEGTRAGLSMCDVLIARTSLRCQAARRPAATQHLTMRER